MNANALIREFAPRLAALVLLLSITLLGASLLDAYAVRQAQQMLAESSQRGSVYAGGWLQSKANALKVLAGDPRLAAPDSTDATQRRIMYEYTYLNNVAHTYFLQPDQPANSLVTANAPELPPSIVTYVQSVAAGSSDFGVFMPLRLRGESYLLAAMPLSAITQDESGIVVTLENLQQAFADLQGPLSSVLRGIEFSLFYVADSLPVVGIERLNAAPARIQPINQTDALMPYLRPGTFWQGSLQRDALKQVVHLETVRQRPTWIFYTGKPWAAVIERFATLKDVMWLLSGLLAVVIMLFPGQQGVLHTLWQRLKEHLSADARAQRKAEQQAQQEAEREEAEVKAERAARQDKMRKTQENISEKLDGQSQSAAPVVPNTEKMMAENRKKAEKLPPSGAEVAYQIREAIRHRSIKFMYQPIVDTNAGTKIMHEVYLRMFDEKGNMLQPAVIFPAAAKFGLEPDIDEAVIRTVIKKHMTGVKKLKRPLAINLTGETFESIGFLQELMDSTTRNPDDAALFVFEVRSRQILEDKRTMEFIRTCRDIGCKFSVDYLGGGVRTVHAAKKLKFDYMKLDGFYFDPDKMNKSKMKELSDIAKAANDVALPLIMEKIESQKLVWLCQKLEIPYIQGYHIEKPKDTIG